MGIILKAQLKKQVLQLQQAKKFVIPSAKIEEFLKQQKEDDTTHLFVPKEVSFRFFFSY